ncbi:hypothetical protein TWF281_011142 [Arthrobotrys megalospora]
MRLPSELHYQILSYLHVDDHPPASFVCQLWKAIISNGRFQARRRTSYYRALYSGEWFIVHSILHSGKLKLQMELTPDTKKIRFFWKFGLSSMDQVEITDCALLDEAALVWPVDSAAGDVETGCIYGLVEAFWMNNHRVDRVLIYQKRKLSRNNIINVRNFAIESAIEAVTPFLDSKGCGNVQLYCRFSMSRLMHLELDF